MLTAFDFVYVVRELQPLVGAIFDKIYQPDFKTFLMQLHQSGTGKIYVMIRAGEAIYQTTEKPAADNPSGFVMYLRKKLDQARITSIEQKGFERIIEITFNNGITLIVELFSKGNLLVIENDEIISCLEEQTWKDRTVKKGEKYVYPPLKHDPLSMEAEELQAVVKNSDKDNLAITLATDLAFSGKYAEELCIRAGIDPRAKRIDFTKLAKMIHAMTFMKIEANSIMHEKKMIISPITMKLYAEEEQKPVLYPTFQAAIQAFYNYEAGKIATGKEEHYYALAAQQEAHIKELEEKAIMCKEKGDLIYSHYTEIEALIAEVKKNNWNVKHDLIKQLNKSDRKFIVSIQGMDISIDILKNTTSNANFYYEAAKRARKKIPGTIQALETLKQKALKEHEHPRTIILQRKKGWYERFRWFRTSTGKLVIGGRDATTNDILVKKYIAKDDLVFHTETPGSPFVVIKTEKTLITKEEEEEAAQFCASNSRVWGKQETVADVYSIKPDQIKKELGLPKGSFMIYGDRTYYKPTLAQSIGKAANSIIMGGPPAAIKIHCAKYVTVHPGNEKKSDIAKKIKYLLQADDLNEIMQALPPGGCVIV
ncbi:MAG: ribosome rescue protein RqcH [Nanoarchaeota archaeon]|nr:ribosome rescue protein RqcH [Nanoarchaeota archaeon]